MTAAPSSLATCLAETETLPWLDDDVRRAISDRVELNGLEPLALWTKAEQFCDSMDIARRLSQSQELFLQNLMRCEVGALDDLFIIKGGVLISVKQQIGLGFCR